jgi:hypothetical protein
MTEYTRIDTDHPVAPPDPRETSTDPLPRIYRWAIGRFTAPEWTIQSLGFEANDHAEENPHLTPVLEGTLAHESGAIIQIHPNDPDHTVGHGPGFPIYDHHRVRLRVDPETAFYVSLPETPTEPTGPRDLANLKTHPFRNAQTNIVLHEQESIHNASGSDTPTQTSGKEQYSIKDRWPTVIAVYGAAHHVIATTGQQAGLEAFETA